MCAWVTVLNCSTLNQQTRIEKYVLFLAEDRRSSSFDSTINVYYYFFFIYILPERSSTYEHYTARVLQCSIILPKSLTVISREKSFGIFLITPRKKKKTTVNA
jgi:hypothetical protein